jgi:tetratricopeptide (TPR) repeat protein
LGRLYEAAGAFDEAAIAYVKALESAPDYQEARFALMSLGYEAPGEAEIKSDPQAFTRFEDRFLQELGLRRLEQAEINAAITAEQMEQLRQGTLLRMTEAARRRMPTVSEVSAVLFPPAGEDEPLPSATDPVYGRDVDIVLNTYPYHFAQGERFQRMGNLEQAVAEYRAAIEIDPNRMEALLNLGDVLMQLERSFQAVSYYNRAMEQFPNEPRPWLKLGNYYRDLRQIETARVHYRQCLRLDPEFVEAYNNLAVLALDEENYDEAISLLSRAIEIDPAYALAYFNLGTAYQAKGDYLSAIRHYQRHIDLEGPQSAEARRRIAEIGGA